MQVCEFQKRAALNVKILILKSKYSPIQSKKRESKTLANYSNIKPALSSNRRIFKTNNISIESNSFISFKTASLGHISRKQCGKQLT
jgi:hypothetical protein